MRTVTAISIIAANATPQATPKAGQRETGKSLWAGDLLGFPEGWALPPGGIGRDGVEGNCRIFLMVSVPGVPPLPTLGGAKAKIRLDRLVQFIVVCA